MIVYKITPGIGLNPFIESDIEDVVKSIKSWMEEYSDIGDVVSVEMMEMEEEVYNNIPDYEGP